MLLWPDQVKGCTAVGNAFAEGKKRIILCSPTGSGKTVMATSVTQEWVAAGKRVTFLAPRIELITQMCKKLDQWLPLGYGLITARAGRGQSSGMDLYNRVQVASVDTLVSRAVKRGSLILPPTDLVIADEIHLYMTKLRQDLFNLFGDVRVLGLSATPAAPNGRALSGNFEQIIEVTTVGKLTRDGYLCPVQYKAPQAPDMEKVQVVMGEYNAKQTEVQMAPLLGNIVEHWMKWGTGRSTILFAQSVSHSLYMRNQFLEAGVTAEHLDGKTDPDERARILERYESGETEMLCNCEVLTYGVDLPRTKCIIDAAPTKSIVKYLQRIGRGMRIWGSSDLMVLDHAGNIHEHGYAHDDRHWSLDGYEGIVTNITKARAKKTKTSGAPKRLTCPQCATVFSGSLTCAECNYHFEGLAREFHVVDGELVPFSTDDEGNIFARVKFYCELMAYAKAKGKKPAWCDHTYRERFKKWPQPRWSQFQPLEPSRETLRYIKYRQIAWVKGQQARARRA